MSAEAGAFGAFKYELDLASAALLQPSTIPPSPPCRVDSQRHVTNAARTITGTGTRRPRTTDPWGPAWPDSTGHCPKLFVKAGAHTEKYGGLSFEGPGPIAVVPVARPRAFPVTLLLRYKM